MANGWTPERKAKQAALIRSWRPWEKSTGPRSAEGKARAALNGDPFPQWKAERENLRQLKAEVKDLLKRQRELLLRAVR